MKNSLILFKENLQIVLSYLISTQLHSFSLGGHLIITITRNI